MKTKDRFRIAEFKNPKSVAFRVYGRKEDGQVIRENFKVYAQALARKQELEIEAINSPLVLVMQPTRLSTLQLRDAEAAYRMMASRSSSSGFTLLGCVEHFLKHKGFDLTEVTIEEAVKTFLAEKATQNLRDRTLATLRRRVGKLARTHGAELVSEISLECLKKMIQRPEKKPLTINSDRSALHGFFEWCVGQEYCTANPVSRISPARLERHEPAILSMDQVKALLVAARDFKAGVLMPYFSLALFCGLRPTELSRLSWESVDLENKLVTIRGATAKLRARRMIELGENVVEWLKPHHEVTPIVGPNFRRDFDSVRRACGFRGSVYRKKCDAGLLSWPFDVLRHTAISFWQAHFKDEGACADRHGNSVEVVHRFYRGLVRPQDASLFWRLTPANVDAADIILLTKAAAA